LKERVVQQVHRSRSRKHRRQQGKIHLIRPAMTHQEVSTFSMHRLPWSFPRHHPQIHPCLWILTMWMMPLYLWSMLTNRRNQLEVRTISFLRSAS
jgi:hypothetical protein